MTTENLAYLGAVLLGLATLPQALILLRTRDVHGFGWSFSLFNFLGLAFLAARSLAIGEWAFLGINLLTTAFWGMVVGMKLLARLGPRPEATSAPLPSPGPDHVARGSEGRSPPFADPITET